MLHDTAGRSFTGEKDFTIINPFNQDPKPKFTGPPDGMAPVNFLLDASPSTDDDGQIIKYEWDVNNDGVWDFTGPQLDYSFVVQGPGVVKLRVTDNDLSAVTTSRSFTLQSGWTQHMVATPISLGDDMSAAATKNGVSTRIALAYRDSTAQQLMYLYSNDDAGTSWAVAPLVLDTVNGNSGYDCKVLPRPDVSGYPQVFWAARDASYNISLHHRIANNSSGSSWGAIKKLTRAWTEVMSSSGWRWSAITRRC